MLRAATRAMCGAQAVMSGSEARIIKGTALCLIDELPFKGLARFGAAFLNHFEASICDAELLEHLTFVDTPGVLVSERQGAARGYDFSAAVKWFADRCARVQALAYCSSTGACVLGLWVLAESRC
jgi:hypothetical protein